MTQVPNTHYNFKDYLDKFRWLSYWHQINEIISLEVKDVLVIGVGDKIVPNVIESIKGKEINITTFDFDKNLNTDYVGDIRDILKIIGDKKFDAILCCQVLEHLEYKEFDNIINQFSAIAKRVIISLPYYHKGMYAGIKLPKLGRFYFHIICPVFWKVKAFDGQHYWEVGMKGCSKKKIRRVLSKYFEIQNQYHVETNIYHLFFILKTKNKAEVK